MTLLVLSAPNEQMIPYFFFAWAILPQVRSADVLSTASSSTKQDFKEASIDSPR